MNLPKIAILFSGNGTNMEYIMKHLHGLEIEVVLALTNNPQAKGIEIAESYEIPCKIIEHKDYKERGRG